MIGIQGRTVLDIDIVGIGLVASKRPVSALDVDILEIGGATEAVSVRPVQATVQDVGVDARPAVHQAGYGGPGEGGKGIVAAIHADAALDHALVGDDVVLGAENVDRRAT